MLLSKFGTIPSGAAAGGSTPTTINGIATGDLTSLIYGAEEVGWMFQVGASNIKVVGLRIKLNSVLTRTINLWDSAGNNIGNVTVTSEAGAWVTGTLASPVTLTAGSQYTVSATGTPSYNAAPTALTFNRITWVNGRYNTTPGAYPNANWANTVNKCDIVMEE
jgi:hypothetical protein